jgi:hypothetical protein
MDPNGNPANRVQKMYAYYEKSYNVDLHYHVLLYMLNMLNNRKHPMQLTFAKPSHYLRSLINTIGCRPTLVDKMCFILFPQGSDQALGPRTVLQSPFAPVGVGY